MDGREETDERLCNWLGMRSEGLAGEVRIVGLLLCTRERVGGLGLVFALGGEACRAGRLAACLRAGCRA